MAGSKSKTKELVYSSFASGEHIGDFGINIPL